MPHDEGYVPPERWAKDHWRTLAYIETVIVECGGFEVGFDPRMRQCRQHFRIMNKECPRPKRNDHPRIGIPMDSEHGTLLSDGSRIGGHDDWHCVQDLAASGLIEQRPEEIEPGAILQLSTRGRVVANALRAYKASGGKYEQFTMPGYNVF